jgi:hypothetical protein
MRPAFVLKDMNKFFHENSLFFQAKSGRFYCKSDFKREGRELAIGLERT